MFRVDERLNEPLCQVVKSRKFCRIELSLVVVGNRSIIPSFSRAWLTFPPPQSARPSQVGHIFQSFFKIGFFGFWTSFWKTFWVMFSLFWGMLLRCVFGRLTDHPLHDFGIIYEQFLKYFPLPFWSWWKPWKIQPLQCENTVFEILRPRILIIFCHKS